MADVVLINGAPNLSSRLNGLLSYAVALLENEGVDYEIIQIHQLPAEDLMTASFSSQAIQKANETVERAGGVIILTPVFKGSYSGILKSYLDLIPQKGFEDKIILPLVIGGTLNHLLAVDYALKPVLSVLGAKQFASSTYVLDQHIERVGNQQFILSSEIEGRVKNSVKEVIAYLSNKRGETISQT